MLYPKSLEVLIRTLNKLPSIGHKTAERLAFHLISMDPKLGKDISNAILDSIQKIGLCSNCKCLCEDSLCQFCESESRNTGEILVVQLPQHVFHIESSSFFQGRYHVLHGLISPLDGIYATDINIDLLMDRVEKEHVKELILGLNPNLEGEATSQYIKDTLDGSSVTVSKFAIGMPSGGDLEYTDLKTLARAVQGRIPI